MATRARPAIPVRGIRVGTNDIHDFDSIFAASRWLSLHGHPSTNHRHSIKSHIENQREYCGYMWMILERETQPEPDIVVPPQDSLSIILGYAGNTQVNIRTTPENPRRISVFDLITVMTSTNHPRDTYRTVCTQHPEVVGLIDDFMFHGQGQRPTPVVDARGAVYLMNVLQGQQASLFRIHCADVVVRYLGGDQTLIADIQRNAEIQEALPQESPMRMFGEVAELSHAPVVEVQRNGLGYECFKFLSPCMEGKYLDDYKNRNVVYLVVFAESYIKFGKSEDSWERMKTHIKTYPGAQLYCMLTVTHMKRVEDAFKSKMSSRGFLRDVTICGRNYSEVVTDVEPSSAEMLLKEVVDDIDQGDYTKIRLEELAIQKLQIQSQLAVQAQQNKISLLTMLLEKTTDMAIVEKMMTLLCG
jgi:hypothetical protein